MAPRTMPAEGDIVAVFETMLKPDTTRVAVPLDDLERRVRKLFHTNVRLAHVWLHTLATHDDPPFVIVGSVGGRLTPKYRRVANWETLCNDPYGYARAFWPEPTSQWPRTPRLNDYGQITTDYRDAAQKGTLFALTPAALADLIEQGNAEARREEEESAAEYEAERAQLAARHGDAYGALLGLLAQAGVNNPRSDLDHLYDTQPRTLQPGTNVIASRTRTMLTLRLRDDDIDKVGNYLLKLGVQPGTWSPESR